MILYLSLKVKTFKKFFFISSDPPSLELLLHFLKIIE